MNRKWSLREEFYLYEILVYPNKNQNNKWPNFLVLSIVEVCRGSSEGVSTSGANDVARYIKLKKRYQNCTYVDGNLEIKFLEQGNETFDLSFLSKIEEVSGYVLITSVVAETIPLTSLKLFEGTSCLITRTIATACLLVWIIMKREVSRNCC